jgi:hypothetical protein
MELNDTTEMETFFFKEKEMRPILVNKLLQKRAEEELEILKKKLSKEYLDICSDLCDEKLPDWSEEATKLIVLRILKIIIDALLVKDHKIKEINTFSARV